MAADVSYYRNILEDQTNLLGTNIEKYEKILEDLELPESVVGQILSVIGQSKLFINERFKQFSGLIDDCECKRGPKETKVEDLAGFWDMISYQIDDLKLKYDELEQLQSNNWVEVPEPSSPSTTADGGSIRKPFQATNGRTKKTTNGNIRSKTNNNNNNDIVDANAKTTNKHKPVRSNFKEFLKAKKQQQRKTSDPTEEDSPVIVLISNGVNKQTNGDDDSSNPTSSNNGDHENKDDIQIVNNSHQNGSSKLNNGHHNGNDEHSQQSEPEAEKEQEPDTEEQEKENQT